MSMNLSTVGATGPLIDAPPLSKTALYVFALNALFRRRAKPAGGRAATASRKTPAPRRPARDCDRR